MMSITPSEPVRTTITTGRIVGQSFGSIHRFLGIPYAQPPVGRLRFQLPEPALKHDRDLETTQFGPPPPKMVFPASGDPTDRGLLSEQSTATGHNWLTVNVWAPAQAQDAPVFVWIYGGSFMQGSGSELIYDGTSFARDGIVFVSFNYRLGMEGFGVFPDAPSNRGIADQICALEWVRDNIAAFGGDPHNVTIGGESAGSMSVGILVASPQAQGLFHRAIMQSGAPKPMKLTVGQNYLQDVAHTLGVEPTAAAFAELEPEVVISAMQQVSSSEQWAAHVLVCSPIVDANSNIVPVDPFGVLTTQEISLPLLIGANAAEFQLWLYALKLFNITWEQSDQLLEMMKIPAEVIDSYKKYYDSGSTPAETLCAIMSDFMFVQPIREIVQKQRHSYAYLFSWESPVGKFGACHVMELPFVFDSLQCSDALGLAGKQAPQELADKIHSAWVEFISTGKAPWRPAGESATLYNFDYPLELCIEVDDPRADILDVWTKSPHKSPHKSQHKA